MVVLCCAAVCHVLCALLCCSVLCCGVVQDGVFELEEHEAALAAFMAGLRLDPNNATLKKWIRKAEAELQDGECTVLCSYTIHMQYVCSTYAVHIHYVCSTYDICSTYAVHMQYILQYICNSVCSTYAIHMHYI